MRQKTKTKPGPKIVVRYSSFRLRPPIRRLLIELARKLGVDLTAVVSIAVRQLARAEGILKK